MTLYVGTSGFSYTAWRGLFYPADLPEQQMLSYYGSVFASVELNNTFHRMPRAAQLEAWGAQVPHGFRFAMKAPQRITHLQRLKGVEDLVSYLFAAADTLGEMLGPILFQLPPSLKMDLPLLRDFLALFPPGRRAAFQFKHRSWLDDAVLDLLKRNGAALCIVDEEGDLEIPPLATASWGYLRLRRPEYPDAELKKWVRMTRERGWEEVFLYFKHEESARGPALARRFLELSA